MSKTTAVHNLVSALVSAEQILGPDRTWNPVNETQVELVRFLETLRSEIPDIPEIETLASWEAEKINSFLRERGFSIELEEFSDGEFGFASVLKVLVEWQKEGIQSTVTTDAGDTYPAAKLKKGINFIQSGESTIACVATKSNDLVFMTMLDEAPKSEFGLLDTVAQLMAAATPTYRDSLVFPMVDLDQEADLSWLLAMSTQDENGTPFQISQAKRQTKFKMNEKGALAEDAVTGAMMATSIRIPNPYVINRPFLLWIERPGLNEPLFVAHITEEDWKNPGEFM